jgi:(R,R)-butanediol dehydrogenase/meso-butanediol dehydrogenase/diacetyl reductase
MRAAVYHGTRDVRVESIAEPGPPAPHEVQLRVLRAGLCGTDAGEYKHGPIMVPLTWRHPASGHQGPLVLGHEFVGAVEAIGSAVDGLRVGDRVVPGAGMWCGECHWCRAGRTNLCARYYTLGLTAHGGLTERVNVPALMCRLVPSGCGDDAASMAQPLAVALHAVNRARVRSGDAVVLIGVGGVGFFTLAGLVARGARVVALDIDDERLADARRCGAAHAFDARADDVEERVRAAFDGEPVAVVAEASGAPGSPSLAQRLVGAGGRMLLVGLQKSPRALDLYDLVLREVEVQTTVAHVCDTDIPEALELLAETELALAALDRIVPLEAVVSDGLEPLADGRVSGKVLVSMSEDGR